MDRIARVKKVWFGAGSVSSKRFTPSKSHLCATMVLLSRDTLIMPLSAYRPPFLAVSRIRDHLVDGRSSLSAENERLVISHYVHMLDELISCLRRLVGYWEVYVDELSEGNVKGRSTPLSWQIDYGRTIGNVSISLT